MEVSVLFHASGAFDLGVFVLFCPCLCGLYKGCTSSKEMKESNQALGLRYFVCL